MFTRVYSSIEHKIGNSELAEAQVMLSNFTQTPGGNATDTKQASGQELSVLAVENSQTEKPIKMKKKGVCAFFKRTWKTVKNTICCCYRGNKPDPEKPVDHEDLADPQPGPSSPGLGLKAYPSPPIIIVTGPEAETSPDSSPSGLKLTPDSDKTSGETLPRSDPSSLELTPDGDQIRGEPLPDAGPSSLQPASQRDLVDPQPGPSTLTADTSLIGSEPNYVSCELTPDPKPEPYPPGFGPSVGSFLSLYDMEEALGMGGYGIVFKGTRRSDGQKVAIKILTKSMKDNFIVIPGCTKALFAEVALNLVLREPPTSPYVIQMYEWFEEYYRHILIFEYPHPCETLFNFATSKGGFLEETVARDLFRQAVLGAKYCADRCVFHGDIKPNNILVNTETLQLKFIDFGCGQLLETSDKQEYECIHAKLTVKSLAILLFRMLHRIDFYDIQMIPSSNISSECCDLIYMCKSSSPTFDEILEHEWLKSH